MKEEIENSLSMILSFQKKSKLTVIYFPFIIREDSVIIFGTAKTIKKPFPVIKTTFGATTDSKILTFSPKIASIQRDFRRLRCSKQDVSAILDLPNALNKNKNVITFYCSLSSIHF